MSLQRWSRNIRYRPSQHILGNYVIIGNFCQLFEHIFLIPVLSLSRHHLSKIPSLITRDGHNWFNFSAFSLVFRDQTTHYIYCLFFKIISYQTDLNKTRPVVYIYDNVQREGEGERERERDIWPKLGGGIWIIWLSFHRVPDTLLCTSAIYILYINMNGINGITKTKKY